MKYAIRYYSDTEALKNADEIILRFNEPHEKLAEYLKEYKQEQRIIVDVSDYSGGDGDVRLEDNLELFAEAHKEHPNFAVMLSFDQFDFITILNDNDIPYFFKERIDTIDKVNTCLGLGVSDIYICNELAFSIGEIAKYIHSFGVNIRMYPNITQTSTPISFENSITKFFIRPDDVPFYEGLVDVLEFYDYKIENHAVMLEIYSDQRWLGSLDDIIIDFPEKINNSTILPNFGERRINCKKRCGHGKCALCDRVLDFVKIAEEIKDKSGKELVIDQGAPAFDEPLKDE